MTLLCGTGYTLVFATHFWFSPLGKLAGRAIYFESILITMISINLKFVAINQLNIYKSSQLEFGTLYFQFSF